MLVSEKRLKIYGFIVWGVLFMWSKILVGQQPIEGVPLMYHYERTSYNAGRQNWSIAQDTTGFLYFANNWGVLEFDGKYWDLISVPNKSIVRSVVVGMDETVYVGAFNELGYLANDTNLHKRYQSLLSKVPEQHQNFGEIWRIFPTEKGVFFASFTHAFLLRDNQIEVLLSDESLYYSYAVGNDIYVQDKEQGLRLYNGRAFQLIPNTKKFCTTYNIMAMLEFGKDSVLIGTENNGFYLLHNQKITDIELKAEEFVKNNQLFAAQKIKENRFIFGTVQNGYILTNSQGDILSHINKEKGLKNNTILSVFFDKHRVLWLGLDNGIAAIQIDAPIKTLGEAMEINGAGYTSFIDSNYIYFGTNQGLFYKSANKNNANHHYKLIKGSEGQVWALQKINNHILLSHNKGAFEVIGDQTKPIAPFDGNWTFTKLRKNKNIVISGTYNGLAKFELQNAQIVFKNRIKGFEESCRTVYEDDFGDLWVAHGYKGIFRIKLNSSKDSVVSFQLYNQSRGLPSDFGNELFEFRGQWAVSSTDGVYGFSYETNTFEKGFKYDAIIKQTNVKQAIEANNNLIWLITNTGVQYLVKQQDGTYLLKQNRLSSFNKRLIPAFEHLALYNNHLIVGYENGFIAFDTKHPIAPNQQTYCKIRKVWANDSLVYGGAKPQQSVVYLAPDKNNIRIRYSTLNSIKINNLTYSYKLNGLDNRWSKWTNSNEKEFSKLAPGAYTFEIKSKDYDGKMSLTDSFSFVISPPWHRTAYAFLVYMLIAAGAVFWLYGHIRKKIATDKQNLQQKQKEELKRQQEHYETIKLRQEKELIKLRNDNLRAEIEQQKHENILRNSELTAVTMQITHKNEVLNNLKNKISKVLLNVNIKSQKELSNLVQMIEADLRLDDDWERFEKNFELVHKGFFKRLKQHCHSLTPNDLKMCAYLRMNLSSKEISPLMNISIRSVENSRYRLRKKFRLDKDEKLTDFIIQI